MDMDRICGPVEPSSGPGGVHQINLVGPNSLEGGPALTNRIAIFGGFPWLHGAQGSFNFHLFYPCQRARLDPVDLNFVPIIRVIPHDPACILACIMTMLISRLNTST